MTFGHSPFHTFGHGPFGYSYAVHIWDLAHNPLTSGTTGQMLGWTDLAEVLSQETLNLKIYSFFLDGIREEDKKNHFFLQKFIQGPEDMWATIQEKIFSVKNLWNVLEIEDDHLQYLKRIVGWTKETDSITDALDTSTLRRLIATSVALWKERGPERSLLSVLLLTTNARLRIYNWFDYRWILDETILEESHQGHDSWMIGAPGATTFDEYTSSLRIVDDGTLDRDLVLKIVRLMRASGERWEVYYITFLDMFISDADNYQWSYFSSTLTVSDGTAKFEDDASREIAVVTTDETYRDYVVYGRINGTSLTSDGMFGLVFYSDGTEDNCYTASVNTNTNYIQVHKIVAGSKTLIASFNYVSLGYLTDDEWYGLRVQICAETPGSYVNRIKVFVDAEEVIDFTDSTFSNGTFGFWHEANATIEVDEIEMFTLPLGSDYVDINS